MEDGMDPAAFTDIVMQNAGAEAADLQSIIAVMNPTQLATSLQHMALQYRDMQNAATGIWDTDEEDDRASVREPMGHPPMPLGSSPGRVDGRETPEPAPFDDEEYTLTHPSTHDDRLHTVRYAATDRPKTASNDDPLRSPRAISSATPVTPRPTPHPAGPREVEAAPEEPARKDNSRHHKMPAAKLETFAGQGASVEAFLAKFESYLLRVGGTR